MTARRIAFLALLALIIAIGVVLWRNSQPDADAPLRVPAHARTSAPSSPARTAPEAATAPRQPVAAGTAPVAGHVLGANGQPAAGARVRLHRVVGSWPELRTEIVEECYTCEAGEFTFQTARGPDLMVEARARGQRSELLDAPPQVSRLTVQLMHAFAVEGYVVDRFGSPVAGCEVVMEPGVRSMRPGQRTKTDSRGRFLFENASPDVMRITARHPRFQPATAPAVTVGSGEVLRLQFRQPALAVRGVVVTEKEPQRPIASATVRAFPSAWNGGLCVPLETRSDPQGHFQLQGVGEGNLRLEVSREGFSTTSRLVAVNQSVSDLRFELVGRSAVSGRLLSDRPTADIELVLLDAAGERGRTSTDAEGRFAFPGRFSIGAATIEMVSGELCFQASSRRELEFEIEEGAPTTVAARVVPAAMVRGSVRNEQGEPIAGVRIMAPKLRRGPMKLLQLIAVTDALGSYSIAGLSGESTLVFQHDDYAVQETVVHAPRPGATSAVDAVVLVKPGGITGTVTRADNPVAGAVVMMGSPGKVSYYEFTGPDGRFTIRELPPGRYRLRVSWSSLYVSALEEEVEVQAGRIAGPFMLTLPPGRTITGAVVDPDHRPLGDVLVTLNGEIGSSTHTDSSGRFSLDVPVSDVDILAFAPELLISKSEHVAANRNEVELMLPLVPHGTVTGRVRGLPGRKLLTSGILRIEPLETVHGAVEGERAWQRRVRARPVNMPGGEFRLEQFPAGASRLVLQCQGFAPSVQELDLQRGETKDLGTILMEPGLMVRGVVLDANDKPIPGAAIHVGIEHDFYVSGGDSSLVTDMEGRFEVHGVSQDANTLVVSAPGLARQTVQLQLPDDVLRREPLQVHLEPGSDIDVQVVDPSGRPKRQSVVLLFRDGIVLDHGYLADSGHAMFRQRAPGRYTLRLFGDDAVREALDVSERGKVYHVTLKTSR